MKLIINSDLFAQLNQSKGFCVFYTLLLVSLSTYFFSNNSWQSITWTFPYFSGAANFETLFDWKISPSDYVEILERSATEGNTDFYYYYKHQKTDDLIENVYNSYGYVIVAKISQKLFSFLGDLQGAVWLQIAVHALISISLIIITFERLILRYGLVIFYASNPLIIYYATFPFYYFWMVLPSFFLVIILLQPDWKNWWIYLSTPFLIFSLMIRPTTIFLSCWTLFVTFRKIDLKKFRIINLPILGVFIGSVIFVSQLSKGSPWHMMYVGLGAYPNNVGIDNLDDAQGYNYFESKTGIKIDTNAITGNWNNTEIQNSYQLILKDRYFEIVSENPVLFVKNAIINLLQVFSVGYIVDRPILTYMNTFLGFIVLVFLIYTKQFFTIIAIFANTISFVWYFPPIPAYNFATYLLLVVGVLFGTEMILKKYLFR